MQPADGDHRPTRRTGGQRRVTPVPFPQPGQEVRDVLRADLLDLGLADGGEGGRVSLQVTPVSLEGVRGQATFHGQMIEITRDRARECRSAEHLRQRQGRQPVRFGNRRTGQAAFIGVEAGRK